MVTLVSLTVTGPLSLLPKYPHALLLQARELSNQPMLNSRNYPSPLCFLFSSFHYFFLIKIISLLFPLSSSSLRLRGKKKKKKMKAPNMETITESLEKSMQICSLNDRRRRVVGDGFGRSSSNEHTPISDRTLELNSHLSLPCHWEQCLDLKVNNEIHLSIFYFIFCFLVSRLN